MNPYTRYLPVLTCLVATNLVAADTTKVKVLDKLDQIDAKTIKLHEAKGKIVITEDSEHRKALELVIDYAKANTGGGFNKSFAEGTINPKKYSAIRFWVRGNSGTGFYTHFGGHHTRKDGNLTVFNGGVYTTTTDWKQITIPLEKFERNGDKIWKNSGQVIIPGGDAPDDEDFAGFDHFGISSGINNRGSSTAGHLMFDGIELVER